MDLLDLNYPKKVHFWSFQKISFFWPVSPTFPNYGGPKIGPYACPSFFFQNLWSWGHLWKVSCFYLKVQWLGGSRSIASPVLWKTHMELVRNHINFTNFDLQSYHFVNMRPKCSFNKRSYWENVFCTASEWWMTPLIKYL